MLRYGGARRRRQQRRRVAAEGLERPPQAAERATPHARKHAHTRRVSLVQASGIRLRTLPADPLGMFGSEAISWTQLYLAGRGGGTRGRRGTVSSLFGEEEEEEGSGTARAAGPRAQQLKEQERYRQPLLFSRSSRIQAGGHGHGDLRVGSKHVTDGHTAAAAHDTSSDPHPPSAPEAPNVPTYRGPDGGYLSAVMVGRCWEPMLRYPPP